MYCKIKPGFELPITELPIQGYVNTIWLHIYNHSVSFSISLSCGPKTLICDILEYQTLTHGLIKFGHFVPIHTYTSATQYIS